MSSLDINATRVQTVRNAAMTDILRKVWLAIWWIPLFICLFVTSFMFAIALGPKWAIRFVKNISVANK